MKKKSVFKCSYKYLPLYIIAAGFLFIASYISSLISMFIGEALAIFSNEEHVLPDFLAKYVDRSSTQNAIISVCIVFVVMAAISALARLGQNFCKVIATNNIDSNVSITFFDHAIRLPRSYLVSHPTGDIIQRNIQDSAKYANMLNVGLWHFLACIFAIVTVFIQIYSLSTLNFLVGLIVIGIVVIFGIFFSFFYIRKREAVSSRLASKVDSASQQSFSNVQMVKTFASEEFEKEKFSNMVNQLEDVKYDVQKSYANYWAVIDVIACIYRLVSFLVIGFLCFNGSIGLGAATSLVILNGTVVDNSSDLVGHINNILRNSVSIPRLNEYLAVDEDFISDGNLTPDIKGNITFDHVSMAYDDDPNSTILHDVSFSVNQGETIGIVGKSGSGKSTLINVLTRLDDYDEGSVKIDGIELKDINKQYLRDNMGIVNQESFIFSRTIKDNLTILTKNDSNLESYIDRVCLKEDIEKMNEGLDTVVGERGVTLSGGQRQRISIARSLMKNKNILILDDSLSAVDNNVAKEIKRQLKKNKCTTFIISHNLMNIMDADKIIVIDGGKIIQEGNHESLVKQKGLYRDIFNLQQNIQGGDEYEA